MPSRIGFLRGLGLRKLVNFPSTTSQSSPFPDITSLVSRRTCSSCGTSVVWVLTTSFFGTEGPTTLDEQNKSVIFRKIQSISTISESYLAELTSNKTWILSDGSTLQFWTEMKQPWGTLKRSIILLRSNPTVGVFETSTNMQEISLLRLASKVSFNRNPSNTFLVSYNIVDISEMKN